MSQPRKTHTTAKGTVLQLIDLKGKDYLPVQQRIIWFREEKPNWRIETKMIEFTLDVALFKALIRDENGNIIATGHKSETRGDFKDYAEKAESSAVGRALAFIGYGTQFCGDEMNELADGKERLADSPTTTVQNSSAKIAEVTKQLGKELQNHAVPAGDHKPRGLSEKQIKRLFAIAKKNGMTEEMLRSVLTSDYKANGRLKTFDMAMALTRDEYEALCNELQGITDPPNQDDDKLPF